MIAGSFRLVLGLHANLVNRLTHDALAPVIELEQEGTRLLSSPIFRKRWISKV